MRKFKLLMALIALVALSSMTGCATVQEELLKKADRAERTAFLGDKPMRNRADIPFHSAWVKTGFDKARYAKIYVAPVDLSHLREMSWWNEIEGQVTDVDMKEHVERVADYTRDVFKKAFFVDPNQRFRLVREPDDETLILEIAIIEAIPNKAGFETLTRGLGLVNPVVGVAGTLARSQGSKSSVAFEARVRDARTNEIVAQFADREQEKLSYINTKDFQWYSHIKAIIVEWADQFVKIANKTPDDIVADSATFDLKPW